jgi:hypothetical protein
MSESSPASEDMATLARAMTIMDPDLCCLETVDVRKTSLAGWAEIYSTTTGSCGKEAENFGAILDH